MRFFHFRSQKFFVDRGRAFSTLHRATGRDYKNPQTDNYKKTQKRSDSNRARFCGSLKMNQSELEADRVQV